jgi:murein DD-endopeptidase MepM/ murein hydrolase activator NlpD
VTAGEVIALSGSTGRSTAPHLHFEIRRDGRSIDPQTLVQEGY